MIQPGDRIAIYMNGAMTDSRGKMGFGVLRYSPNEITCVIDPEQAGRDAAEVTGISRPCPVVANVADARNLGANVLILGIAPPGGLIPTEWFGDLDSAVTHGFSLVNGLHDLLGPRYPKLAPGQWIWDIRTEPKGIGVGTGAAASLAAKRVLFIGTDMAVGKMTAGLEIHSAALRAGVKSGFVATGQIGMTITGAGVPLDAIRIDFASGSIEREMLANADKELIIVEGQGALIHPGSSANLPLLRGSCPSHMILCHRAGQETLYRIPEIKIPPLDQYWQLYEDLGEAIGTFARPKTIAIALNTGHCTASEAHDWIKRTEDQYGLPCADVLRDDGAERLIQVTNKA